MTAITDTRIGITVPTHTLHYTPGGEPTQFLVEVFNQSDRFATVQLDLLVPGNDGSPDSWYDLTPEISSKKPSGDRTQFHITILDAPIPGFAGLMNLTVRVTSLELGEERRIIRLNVDPGGELPIGIKMPVRQFQAAPLEQVQIPVFLENPSHEKSVTTLWIEGLPTDWVMGGVERVIDIPADTTVEKILVLRLPDHKRAVCNHYTFTLRAVQPGGTTSEATGSLDITPQGHVVFGCTPLTHCLPVRDRHYQWGTRGVRWTTTFNNDSNVPLEASLQVSGDDRSHVIIQVNPDQILVNPGDTEEVQLGTLIHRPWVGLGKYLNLKLQGTISDNRADIQDDTQFLKLNVPPLIPLWVQGLSSIVVLYLIWWFSWLNPGNPFIGHRAAVNSVAISGTADEVISGSSDQTSIRWRVDGFFNPIVNQQIGRSPDADKAIRVVRHRPIDNDWVAAGLENGEIQLMPLSGQGQAMTFALGSDDRILDLEFTDDSHYLFSGHGSGTVLQWPLSYPKSSLENVVMLPLQFRQFDFAVYGIARVGEEESTIAVGGRYNRLSIWDWRKDTVIDLDYPRSGSQSQYITSVDSVILNPNLMATADDQGYITLWDLRPCLSSNLSSNRPCEVIDEWRDGHGGEPIRDIALSNYGCYLTSAGADGRVMLWPLSSSGTRAAQYREGIRMGRSRHPFNTVDVKVWDDHILVASGNENSQVTMRRHPRIYDALCDIPNNP